MRILSARQTFAGFAAFLLSSTSAFAVDAEAFAERLQTALKQHGLALDYADAQEQGQDVIVKGATFTVDDESVEAGDLVFEDVTGSAEQGFKAARLPIKNLGRENFGTAWKASDIALEGIQLAGTGAGATTPVPASIYFDRLAMGELATSRNGEDEFKLTGVEILNDVAANGMVTSRLDLGDFQANLAPHERTDFLEVVEELGYEQFSGSAKGQAAWNPSSGDLQIGPIDISIEDAGTARFSTTIAGYTQDFAKSLAEFQQDEDASSIAALGPASQVSLRELDLSYSDASLFDRLIDYYAETNDLTRDQVVASVKTILPPMLEGLENESFQVAIASAVSEFLKKPQAQSVSVSSKPKTPVSAALMLGVAPQTLPDVLDVEVSAR